MQLLIYPSNSTDCSVSEQKSSILVLLGNSHFSAATLDLSHHLQHLICDVVTLAAVVLVVFARELL